VLITGCGLGWLCLGLAHRWSNWCQVMVKLVCLGWWTISGWGWLVRRLGRGWLYERVMYFGLGSAA
jgi:hypothetical protein